MVVATSPFIVKLRVILKYTCTLPRLIDNGMVAPYLSLKELIMEVTTTVFLCDILRSSKCHEIVHCLPLMILLTMHASYGLVVNPSLAKKEVRSPKNNFEVPTVL